MAPSDDPVKPTPSRRRRWLGVAAAAVCAALAAGVWAVATGTVEIPERFNPWAPLDVAAPSGCALPAYA